MAITNGPNLGLMISAADGDAYGTDLRKLLRAIDALLMCVVKTRTNGTPPVGPVDGERAIVPAGATGAWSGQTNKIASWTTKDPANPAGVWEFYTPKEGFVVYSIEDTSQYKFAAGVWSAV